MNWRHRMALEKFVATVRPIRFSRVPGIGEKTFKTAIENGWLEPVDSNGKGKWWEMDYRATEAARSALKMGAA